MGKIKNNADGAAMFSRNVLIIETLLEFINVSYKNCSTDRGKLHEVEWSGSIDAPSILGELEIIADYYVGVIKSCLNKNLESKDETIRKLKQKSIFDSDVLSEWIVRDGLKYQDYFVYILAVESLRTTTIKILG
jgi:hypothetical protein